MSWGNSRSTDGFDLPFRRNSSSIRRPSDTVVVGDTEGANEGNDAQYCLDPPLTSSRGSGRNTGYYARSDDPNAHAVPSDRNGGAGAFVFADGYAKAMTTEELDDYSGDGAEDN